MKNEKRLIEKVYLIKNKDELSLTGKQLKEWKNKIEQSERERIEKEINKLEELSNKMYNLNANLSALIHIQKLKSREEAEGFLIRINQEIPNWIKIIRELKLNLFKEKN